MVNAAKGNAALVKLIFDYHEGPPPQKHEVTGVFYSGADLQQVLRQIAELMRDFVPEGRWDEFAARLDELDAIGPRSLLGQVAREFAAQVASASLARYREQPEQFVLECFRWADGEGPTLYRARDSTGDRGT